MRNLITQFIFHSIITTYNTLQLLFSQVRCQQNLDIYPVYIHKLVVRARKLASVAQLVRALYRNRLCQGLVVAFFANVPG